MLKHRCSHAGQDQEGSSLPFPARTHHRHSSLRMSRERVVGVSAAVSSAVVEIKRTSREKREVKRQERVDRRWCIRRVTAPALYRIGTH